VRQIKEEKQTIVIKADNKQTYNQYPDKYADYRTNKEGKEITQAYTNKETAKQSIKTENKKIN
jgi:hypothetical protein